MAYINFAAFELRALWSCYQNAEGIESPRSRARLREYLYAIDDAESAEAADREAEKNKTVEA